MAINGRYTLGTITARLDASAESLARIEKVLINHIAEQRNYIEALRQDADKTHAALAAETKAVRERMIGLEHDATTANRLQAGLTLLASAVAAWIGSRQ